MTSLFKDKNKVILVKPRVYIGDTISIGPGKIEILRQVGNLHSISSAARALGMPYKRAWLLIDTLNQGFGKPVIETTTGGKKGGGAVITRLGQDLINCYDALEKSLNQKTKDELNALRALAEFS
ncbi:MAG: LysR family transcriptional regulator [Gammaproteobacteria bacterium]|nr:LysR family transcriptional regulator [Gammaproteobacteria bacterium]